MFNDDNHTPYHIDDSDFFRYPKPSFTIVLWTLIKNNYDLGLQEYPLYESTGHTMVDGIIPTREQLNKKIIDHYKYREIGFETPWRFVDELNIRMNEIMPYYNQLFKSLDIEYNIIHNVDYKEDTTSKGKSDGASTTIGNLKNARVDTPQSQIQVEDINNLTRATELGYGKNTDSGESHGTSEGEYHKHVYGNYGITSSQSLIKRYRELAINIEMQIIGQLNDLFMGVYEIN